MPRCICFMGVDDGNKCATIKAIYSCMLLLAIMHSYYYFVVLNEQYVVSSYHLRIML